MPQTTADMAGKTVVVTAGKLGHRPGDGRRPGPGRGHHRDHRQGPRAWGGGGGRPRRPGGAGRVELVVFDLGDLSSVRDGAAQLSGLPQIDVLVNNAGVVLSERHQTSDGFEATFAMDLRPVPADQPPARPAAASAPSRFVTVASSAHKGARKGMDFADLQSTSQYRG